MSVFLIAKNKFSSWRLWSCILVVSLFVSNIFYFVFYQHLSRIFKTPLRRWIVACEFSNSSPLSCSPSSSSITVFIFTILLFLRHLHRLHRLLFFRCQFHSNTAPYVLSLSLSLSLSNMFSTFDFCIMCFINFSTYAFKL